MASGIGGLNFMNIHSVYVDQEIELCVLTCNLKVTRILAGREYIYVIKSKVTMKTQEINFASKPTTSHTLIHLKFKWISLIEN